MVASVSGGGFEFSIPSVGGSWSWKVLAVNVQGAGQSYEVVDLRTPYGPFERLAMPIPGDVVLAMAESLGTLLQQLAPLLALLNPSATTFNISFVEGDPSFKAVTAGFVNAGAFGSYMTATATPDVPWLKVEPPAAAGLGRNDQGAFDVSVLTGSLLSSASPYSATVKLQDNRTPPTIITLSFVITVLPRPVVSTPASSVIFTYYLSTSSGTGPFVVAVQNSGPPSSILSWSMARVHSTSPWLDFNPASGGPLASGDSQDSLFSLVPAAVPLLVGTYTDSVRISSPNASNGYVDVPVVLNVVP